MFSPFWEFLLYIFYKDSSWRRNQRIKCSEYFGFFSWDIFLKTFSQKECQIKSCLFRLHQEWMGCEYHLSKSCRINVSFSRFIAVAFRNRAFGIDSPPKGQPFWDYLLDNHILLEMGGISIITDPAIPFQTFS